MHFVVVRMRFVAVRRRSVDSGRFGFGLAAGLVGSEFDSAFCSFRAVPRVKPFAEESVVSAPSSGHGEMRE